MGILPKEIREVSEEEDENDETTVEGVEGGDEGICMMGRMSHLMTSGIMEKVRKYLYELGACRRQF